MPLKRLKNKLTCENIWLYILRLLMENPMYAYEIRKRIEDRFGFKIGEITAYIVLYKLAGSGYVRTEWKVEKGRQRKYYKITEGGEKLLKEGIEFIDEMMRRIGYKNSNIS